MSSDNTILILASKNEYRLVHVQAADDLYFTWTGDPNTSEPVCARVFEFFSSCNPLKEKDKVLLEAQRLYEELDYVEYGIQSVATDKTFKEIVEQAIKDYDNEISSVRQMTHNLSFEHRKDIVNELKNYKKEAQKWLSLHL